ncbi:hypothetical protein [Aquabacter spiritensis]|uniref:Uncharacterized protein n=1 Tax=Aquabacter spiritensis TaxID=933073 RepID=A0A4R3M3C5_9HYPH|nr:hypothetical protein [Aquabacter spiritensis]TCT07680.1 hypothetical protein EDC64_101199 [Aquabacter spiritensis]
MRCTRLCAIAALLLLAGPSAFAQPQGAQGFDVACPPTLDLTYQGVAQLSFEGKEFDMSGWTPGFAPASARLIEADVTPPADAKGERMSGMADNAETAKPGQPLIYTIWQKGKAEPDYAAVVTCGYEGGLALQKAIPRAVHSCTLRAATRKAAATDPSTRRFYTSAVFSCR